MPVELFFNELSLEKPSNDIGTARLLANKFVDTIVEAVNNGVERALHIPSDFENIPLAPRYYWGNWRGDSTIDLERRQYFRSLATKKPFLCDDNDKLSVWSDIDCLHDDKRALGFKAAYVSVGLAISIASGSAWDTPHVSVKIHKIDEEEYVIEGCDINHASCPSHIDSHIGWVRERRKIRVNNSSELRDNIQRFFPNLTFCKEVGSQIDRLPKESLEPIIDVLFRLNDYCIQWESGPFDPNIIGYRSTPESDATINDPKYRSEREFTSPEGQKVIFSWHAKPGPWRIYYDPKPGAILVGYIGRHLRTAKYN